MKGLVSKGTGMLCWYGREFGNDTNDGGLMLETSYPIFGQSTVCIKLTGEERRKLSTIFQIL